MVYGLIFSAGKESRFKSDIPKSLSPYKNTTVLDHNIEVLSKYCDTIFVICSNDNKAFFDRYNTITIDSGFGCGDAVLKALTKIDFTPYDKCFIQWGDCIAQKSVIGQICDMNCDDRVIIPCTIEDSPYVELTQMEDSISVQFKKYNEPTKRGYHDFGLFYCSPTYLFPYLCYFSTSILLNNAYIHKHDNEMQFLDVFNETDIKGAIVEIEDCKTISFNTIEELIKL